MGLGSGQWCQAHLDKNPQRNRSQWVQRILQEPHQGNKCQKFNWFFFFKTFVGFSSKSFIFIFRTPTVPWPTPISWQKEKSLSNLCFLFLLVRKLKISKNTEAQMNLSNFMSDEFLSLMISKIWCLPTYLLLEVCLIVVFYLFMYLLIFCLFVNLCNARFVTLVGDKNQNTNYESTNLLFTFSKSGQAASSLFKSQNKNLATSHTQKKKLASSHLLFGHLLM